MARGKGELTLDCDDFERRVGAHHVPEGGLTCGSRDSDTGRTAVYVVGQVGGFRVAGQRTNSTYPGLRHYRVISKVVIFKNCLKCASAATEPECVNGKH